MSKQDNRPQWEVSFDALWAYHFAGRRLIADPLPAKNLLELRAYFKACVRHALEDQAERRLPTRGRLYCWLMNRLDFRYWRCECEYTSPYGKAIMGGCPKHD